MFRIGGSAGTGITSGLDRKPFQEGTDPYDRALKTTERFMTDIEKFKGRKSGLRPGSLPGFLTQFGLNLASATPSGTGFGGLAATAAKAAQSPFQTFQAAKLAEREDRADRADIATRADRADRAGRQTNRQTDRQTDRQLDRQTNRQTQTDRQTDRQTDGRTDR